MKKTILLISSMALIKLIIQLIGNRNYGFHRDELLHLSVSEHLDWGYMEFPPFIAWIGRASNIFFNYSLMGTRLFPTLAGVLIVIVTCLMAREFKSNNTAVFLSGICILAFLPFYRNHTLFQPVAFDQLFWTLGFYYLIRYMNTDDKKYLLYTGGVLGFGLLNKYTMFIWAFGMLIGILLNNRERFLNKKFFYLSGMLALIIFLPNLIWQLQNDLPIVRHFRQLQESQLSGQSSFEFVLEQFNFPITLVVSMIGYFFLFRSGKFRSFGIAGLVIFITMWYLQAKPYYMFALYPLLFAAGSAMISKWIEFKSLRYRGIIASFMLIPSLYYLPHLTPLLSIEKYISYAELDQNNDRVELTSDYADMFGWEEQVKVVDSLYRSLPREEKKNCIIWAENYGEAGAITILGDKYGLPNPICRHGSFWMWGYGNDQADVWISLGNEAAAVNYAFEEVELIKTIYHKYAVDEENGIPLYLCRKPKVDIPTWWKDFEPYIFN